MVIEDLSSRTSVWWLTAMAGSKVGKEQFLLLGLF